MLKEKFTPAEIRAISRAKNIIAEKLTNYDVTFNNSQAAADYACMRLAGETNEHFEVIFLNAQNKLIACERLFSGTINSATIYPRAVAKRALELDAVAVIFIHNHPSGTLDVSMADKAITSKLVSCLQLFDISVIDHFIVSGAGHTSFANRGLL